MAKRRSHGARRTTRYRNPYSAHGFSDLPDGTPWSVYGSPPLPPRTGLHNPTPGQVAFWGAVAAAVGYILWKRPDLPGPFDEWVYEHLGHPAVGTVLTTGGAGTTGNAATGSPGLSPITVEIVGHAAGS